MSTEELEELLVPDAAGWRAWLAEHHADRPGVWLALARKGGTTTALGYEDAVLEAMCFGWVDGQARSRDEQVSLIRMTPRRPRSPWSASNVERVRRLEAEGRMTDAGRAAVEAARADGRWEAAGAYAGSVELEVPDDLRAAVAADPRAQAMFDVLTATNRLVLVHRVVRAPDAAARERTVAELVAMLARHEPPYPQRRRPG